ncbi:uncharacterized protein LOC113284268 isoform X1 [Papaver somniferum]|uniref:uncharacterized protein LOC113284268 isoform X1 n=1 Tax=Papaver somniferum TaxID=3469 RepID=UPI000E704A15|nr:uncharacterized protein LOC113284268 isoform X1 [Papaver somniferum]XP_026389474.1 uncharacterized protein LOC113284268 isoform X1 [Papaver somniferum]
MLVKCAFQNKQLFKKHLKRYCVKENKQFKCKKSCSQQVRAQSRFKYRDDCKWFVYASRVEGESTFVIRSVNLEHTCVGDPKSFNRSVDPDLVKDVVLEKLKHSSRSFIPKPRNIAEDFSMLHNIKIPYICAWKARNLVLEELFGDYEESYAEVTKFCSMVADINPGSVAKFTYGRKGICISYIKSFQELSVMLQISPSQTQIHLKPALQGAEQRSKGKHHMLVSLLHMESHLQYQTLKVMHLQDPATPKLSVKVLLVLAIYLKTLLLFQMQRERREMERRRSKGCVSMCF